MDDLCRSAVRSDNARADIMLESQVMKCLGSLRDCSLEVVWLQAAAKRRVVEDEAAIT